MSATSTYLSCADTAKLLRAALKREFPGVKFSVRSHTYAGGASIDVGWTDGPRSEDVRKVSQLYSGADFDGMIDLKTYSSSWIEGDGTVHTAHARGTESSRGYLPEVIEDPLTPQAREVHFGADYVFENRTISDEWTDAIVALFEQVTGYTLGRPSDGWQFWNQTVPLWVDRLDGSLLHMVETEQNDIRDVFRQFTGWRQGGSLELSAGVES